MNRRLRSKAISNASGVSGGPPGQISSVGASVSLKYSYSGPLPHPEILKDYEQILPGSAQRIFIQFEEQSAHRRLLEVKVISSNTFSQRVGSISGAVLGLLMTVGGFWLVHEGKSLAGIGTVIVAIAGLISVYLYQKRSQNQELAEKRTRNV